MADTETYGTYNTPLTTIKHSAMASWSGFVYQGLCALQHVLALLRDDWNNAITKQLSLEAYEDFAILNNYGQIESLHQCKCIQSPTNYTDECHKMIDIRDYWKYEENMLASSSVPLWFHSNMSNTYVCGVKAYPFSPTQTTCSPVNIYTLIQNEIKDLCVTGSSEIKTNKLIVLISKKVSEIHEQSINNPGNSFYFAVNNPIPFADIATIIKDPSLCFELDERIETCRFCLMLTLKNRLLTKRDADESKINKLICDIGAKKTDELRSIIYRLFPDMNILSTNVNIFEMFSTSRGNNLFNVINGVEETIESDDLNWKGNNNMFLTPSTLGMDVDPEEHCSSIVKNPFNAELMRDYRWIIGFIDHKVDDIIKEANIITQSNVINDADITQPQKVGLLDINSKNDGNY